MLKRLNKFKFLYLTNRPLRFSNFGQLFPNPDSNPNITNITFDISKITICPSFRTCDYKKTTINNLQNELTRHL